MAVKTKTKKARRPARKAPSRVAAATAYTRGVSERVVREYPKSTGFVAGVAAAFAVLEVLS